MKIDVLVIGCSACDGVPALRVGARPEGLVFKCDGCKRIVDTIRRDDLPAFLDARMAQGCTGCPGGCKHGALTPIADVIAGKLDGERASDPPLDYIDAVEVPPTVPTEDAELFKRSMQQGGGGEGAYGPN